MTVRIVCLANSFKEGGRCLAGIELDQNNNPKYENNQPKWLRPISKSDHGQIDTKFVDHIHLLDIIELNIDNISTNNNYQSENVYFQEVVLPIVGKYPIEEVNKLCNNTELIFGNRGKAVHEDKIDGVSNSLLFLNSEEFEINDVVYDNNPDKHKFRLKFTFNDNSYDLPITDPQFINEYRRNKNIINKSSLYFTVSLGVIHNSFYYKLIAGIILY